MTFLNVENVKFLSLTQYLMFATDGKYDSILSVKTSLIGSELFKCPTVHHQFLLFFPHRLQAAKITRDPHFPRQNSSSDSTLGTAEF